MANVEELEKLARLATPGPWRWDDHNDRIVAGRASVLFGEPSYEANHGLCGDPADIAYVVAASPDVVLKLLADRRELLKALNEALAIAKYESEEYQGKPEHLTRIPQLQALAASMGET